jgi:hypothetical protein
VRATKGRATDPQAHRLYLLAWHLLERFGRDDTAKTIEYLKQAGRLRLNPPIDDDAHEPAWRLVRQLIQRRS